MSAMNYINLGTDILSDLLGVYYLYYVLCTLLCGSSRSYSVVAFCYVMKWAEEDQTKTTTRN